jgi:hypothetical protein
MSRRKGAIARMPKELRDQVNTMLRDGATYRAIVKYLAAEHDVTVTDNQLGDWHSGRPGKFEGGFQDWLREQERIEDMTRKREFALEIVAKNEGSKIHEATMQIAASQLYEVLTDFDLTELKTLLKNRPQNYAAIVNSLAKVAKQSLETEKFKQHVRDTRERIERELGIAKDKGGIAPETLERIERELRLL